MPSTRGHTHSPRGRPAGRKGGCAFFHDPAQRTRQAPPGGMLIRTCRCGHCKALQPAWEQAAKALKGIVNVGAVDADQHKSLGGEYGVKGFPTIKLMYADDSGSIKSVEFNGGRAAKDIITFALVRGQGRRGAAAAETSVPGAVVWCLCESCRRCCALR